MAENFSNTHPPPFGDTTWTKLFVGGLAWETQSDEMRAFFQQFGEILEAVIIHDKNTGKSKGYGFVTFRDPDSARRACANPNPIICGRRANCNIAAFGRARPPPPPPLLLGGRNQIGNLQTASAAAGSYGGLLTPYPPPPSPPPPQIMFPAYRYRSYAPNYTLPYHQAIYNPQLQSAQLYQPSPCSSSYGYGYGYGYPSSSSPSPRGAFPVHGYEHGHVHGHGPSSPLSSSPSYFPYYTNYTHMQQPLFYAHMHQIATPTTGRQSPTETEGGASGSNTPNTC
ncbi:RNA-binding protein 38-like [Cucurbita pepo subsp. pepo]|uniref:RNA-binding protein 38-like n=1 Tax=Cucurbita pepo subsp. pepo TaxID=3664 RepID=UPI000C9D379F|nr:RNA-binding protein 38-like [Cucurbita pepo subsp. pepo]